MLNSGSEGASLQALKLQATSVPAGGQGFKLQAKILKRQDPVTRVQAHKLDFSLDANARGSVPEAIGSGHNTAKLNY